MAGPLRVGARAILTTVVKDRRTGPTAAAATCTNYADLVAIIDSLAG